MPRHFLSLTVLFLFTLLYVEGITITNTIKKSCTVATDQGTVDLSPVAKTDGKTAAYSADVSTPGFGSVTTFWNPCQNTQLASVSCKNSGEVFQSVSGSIISCLMLSTAAESTFNVRNGNLTLDYTSQSANVNTHITLKCVSTASSTPFTLDADCFDPNGSCFTLSHPVCCPKHSSQTTTPSGGSSGGLSGGSVLLIIVLVLLVCYIVGGILFMKFYKKAQGAELCPNVQFWKAFPLYARDGFMFTIRCCKAPPSGYDSI